MVGCITLSPQRGAGLHGWPGFGQTQPPSSLQLDEHPSPELVLPSSQSSPASMRLLPHSEVRTQGSPGTQVNAGSCTVQVELQPSLSVVFLSSHTSPEPTTPSPQTMSLVHLPSFGQSQFFSTLHTPLQPSPATTLPSSHASMPP